MSGTTDLSIPDAMRIEDITPAPEAPEEKPRNPREEQMRRIAAHYEEQQRATEIAYGEQLSRDAAEREPARDGEAEREEGDGLDATSALADPAVGGEPKIPAPSVPASEPVALPQQPRLLQINVPGYGQPLYVTEDQYAHLASTGAMANMAMHQAQQQPRQPDPAPQPIHQPPTAPVLGRDEAAAIVQQLVYGSQDDGVAAVQALATQLASRMPAQIDPSAIRADVAQQLRSEFAQQRQLESDLTIIGTEFPDVFHHQGPAKLAALNLLDIRQRDRALGRQRPDIDAYREAAQLVRQDFGGVLQQPRPGPDIQPAALQAAPQADRLERKRAAPRNPAAVSRTASLGEETPRPPTGSQIVDQIRRARHQLPMN